MNDTSTREKPEAELKALGSYELEARLGQGGMGTVYLATDKKLHRQVALKVLHPHLLRHENLKERFRREARMHAKLMHPNIVTLLSLYEDDEHMGLVMEMVHGKDLKAYLRDNPHLPLKEKLRIAIHILTGLEAAHKFGMVHRDLKPANVLISKDNEVKLMDFGLAKPEQGEDDLTQSGATVGSFRYMSPEQILNQPIDARTDLYAFGILMFQMSTGKMPFDATSNGGEFEIMEKQVRESPPIPHELNPAIPFSLSQLIINLLEKNKHDRPKDADTVRQMIRQIYNQLEEETPTAPVNQPLPSASAPSNAEVAQQWMHIAFHHLKDRLDKLAPPTFKAPAARLAVVASAFILFGSIVIAFISSLDTTTSNASVAKSQAAKVLAQAAPSPVVKNNVIEAKKTPQVKAKATPKVKAKPKVVVKKKAVRSVAYHRKHNVKRSDKTKVSAKHSHEFRGGKHLFFPELKKKSWFSSSKKGETRIEFKNPVRLSKIIIHKASVGRLKFKHGYIQLEVQSPSGKWKRLFERKDDDLDVKVTIRNVQKHMAKIKAVRLKFKTPEPITIGPIDLLP